MKKFVGQALLVVSLFAISCSTKPKQAPKVEPAAQKKEIPQLLLCQGTDTLWDAQFSPEKMIFSNPLTSIVRQDYTQPKYEAVEGGLRVTFPLSKEPIQIRITRGECLDSEHVKQPFRAEIRIDSLPMPGCCREFSSTYQKRLQGYPE